MAPRDLTDFPPAADWRPILEMISGPTGSDDGSFQATGRYRVRFDCVGVGSIRIRVGGQVRATRDCSGQEVAEPKIVRRVNGRLRAAVTAQGDVEWLVRIEVPR